MPIYEYECLDCEKVFDRIQGMTATPLKVCPYCQGRLQKKLSVPVVHLRSRPPVVQKMLPEFARGGLVLDGSVPPTWPGGYAFGVVDDGSKGKKK